VRSRGLISGSSWTSTTERTSARLHHGFFPPKPHGVFLEEEQAHQAQHQMALEGQVLAETGASGGPFLPSAEAAGDVRVSVDTGRKIEVPAN